MTTLHCLDTTDREIQKCRSVNLILSKALMDVLDPLHFCLESVTFYLRSWAFPAEVLSASRTLSDTSSFHIPQGDLEIIATAILNCGGLRDQKQLAFFLLALWH